MRKHIRIILMRQKSNSRKHDYFPYLCKIAFLTASLVFEPSAHALDVEPDAMDMFPAGTSAALLYLQHADRNAVYVDGKKQSGSPKLTSDLALFRMVHTIGLAEDATWDLNAIMPVGRLRPGGDSAMLGEAAGIGSVMVGGPFKFRVNQGKDIALIGPYVQLPTGAYDHSHSLNLGENRWGGLVMVGYVKQLSSMWKLNLLGDMQVFGDNTNYGPNGATLSQKPLYSLQAALRYALTPSTEIALGGGWLTGGSTNIDGKNQNDKLSTVYGRVTLTHFTKTHFVTQLQLGRDLKVSSGFRENLRVNVRIGYVF